MEMLNVYSPDKRLDKEELIKKETGTLNITPCCIVAIIGRLFFKFMTHHPPATTWSTCMSIWRIAYGCSIPCVAM